MAKSRNAYKQGFFNPIHPKKYVGTHPIVYRSGLELNVMRFFDENSSVITWGSESIVIPYVKPTTGRVHKYYTDFVVSIKDNSGKIHRYVIEVKPYRQTIPPTAGKRKKQKTIITEQIAWAVNSSKWDSAKKWCDKNGFKFTILTEKDIEKYIR